jgi:hypothetical protein
MVAKPALGYPTQKELRAAIKAIVDPYPNHVEFFHPLLQRLFIERPYYGDPPGPTYTKFKWMEQKQPNGKVWDRWFMVYNEQLGWRSRSWNKCVDGKKFDIVFELKAFARWRADLDIIPRHQMNNPACQWTADANHGGPLEVDHLIPMRTIVEEAIALTPKKELAAITKVIQEWRMSDDCTIYDHWTFTKHLLKRHAEPGCLMTLCKNHHYAIEGKKQRNGGTND